jgi:hypothetical protein
MMHGRIHEFTSGLQIIMAFRFCACIPSYGSFVSILVAILSSMYFIFLVLRGRFYGLGLGMFFGCSGWVPLAIRDSLFDPASSCANSI